MKYFSDVDSKVDFKSICFEECLDSNYIKPARMTYIENGKKKVWDIINSYDSVSILLYNQEIDSFLIVRQFRPAVYANNQDGYTYELCAGLIDKEGKSLEQIASEEIFEECGYDVKASDLKKIGSFFASTGISGSKQTIFFATISQENRINGGGGIDDECIDVLFLPLKEAQNFIDDDSIAKTPALAYAIKWYMDKFK
ncbi:NUDIX domain-containing protein [Helicobacter cappadocius]|uniref:NUDIX domain-containing protein n=1 Tax=Helicobacter cappadocius TaxID=3063998 RepID=A0AA90PYV5_9HELI|nr:MULTISPECIES: NUDIX domain-containing protein [unclassified Helicobacter]MDO7252922.1 NUDIX domain-containing protein [Helicobacter sp. faydin-H75]MDP2539088.1 NUDIX domain-containing protein [Helicobacter sp. faydin-H76]